MKKLIYIPVIALLTISIATAFVSCKPSAKEEAAQEKVEEAKDDLAEAKKEADKEDWRNFKVEMNATIDKNEARINELKQSMDDSGKSANAEYERRIDALKEKNDSLKVKMNAYKNDANSDWRSFKSEFNQDMDQLGESLKGFTVKNKK